MEISMQNQEIWVAKNLCYPSWKVLSWLLNTFAVVVTFLHEKESQTSERLYYLLISKGCHSAFNETDLAVFLTWGSQIVPERLGLQLPSLLRQWYNSWVPSQINCFKGLETRSFGSHSQKWCLVAKIVWRRAFFMLKIEGLGCKKGN